jgi:hypothetical protein
MVCSVQFIFAYLKVVTLARKFVVTTSTAGDKLQYILSQIQQYSGFVEIIIAYKYGK